MVGAIIAFAALVGVAMSGIMDRPKVHVVNLVSSIAAVGNPAGSAPSLPARTHQPTTRALAPEPEPRAREAAKPSR